MGKSGTLRRVTTITIFLNVLFNLVFFLNNQVFGDVFNIRREFPTLLTPAAFTNLIWIVIYGGFLIYALYQLSPVARKHHIYEALNPLLLASGIFNILWVISYAFGYVVISVLLLLVMLYCAMRMLNYTRGAYLNHRYYLLFTIPFSLYAGWLTTVVLFSSSLLLSFGGYLFEKDLEIYFSMIILVVTALSAIAVSIKYRDWIYPIAAAWAIFGVAIHNRSVSSSLYLMAVVSAVFLLFWSVIYLLYLAKNRPIEQYRAMAD